MKELGFMIYGKLEMNILGIDLNYNREKGIIQLIITSNIEKVFEEYKEIIFKKKKINSVPSLHKYTINPKTDKLIMDKSILKEKIKWL